MHKRRPESLQTVLNMLRDLCSRLQGNASALISHLSDLQTNNGLKQACAVGGSWELGILQHLLSDLSIEFGAGVAEVALHIDEFLNLVKLAVHLQHGHLK